MKQLRRTARNATLDPKDSELSWKCFSSVVAVACPPTSSCILFLVANNCMIGPFLSIGLYFTLSLKSTRPIWNSASLCQPYSNLSISGSLVPRLASLSADSPFSPSITSSLFQSGQTIYLFQNPSRHSFSISGVRTDSTDYYVDRFFWAVSVFVFSSFHYLSVLVPCGRLSWRSILTAWCGIVSLYRIVMVFIMSSPGLRKCEVPRWAYALISNYNN